MGITNITRFFRRSIESRSNLPAEYNLAIDCTLLLIPILKMSRTLCEFESQFTRYFDESAELRHVIGFASEVYIGLDYYYPAMKQDTCRRRQKEYQRSTAALSVADPTAHPRRRVLVEMNCGECATARTSSARDFLHLKDVRELVQSLFERCVPAWRDEALAAERLLHWRGDRYADGYEERTADATINCDVLGYGEGEIKCFKFREWRDPGLPTVVLSNDNDVLLMMLMHGAMTRASPRTRFFRLAMNSSPRSTGLRLQRISLERMLQTHATRHYRRRLTARQMLVNEHNLWMVVVWLIAAYGNDYVHAIAAHSETSMREWLDTAISHFLRFADRDHYILLNAHNFFFAIMLLFDSITGPSAERDMRYADRQHDMYTHDHELWADAATDESDEESTYAVYNWCLRVYWNVLYLYDLPIEFRGSFDTDPNVPVNLNIGKSRLGEDTVRSLTQRQRRAIHSMFCFQLNELGKHGVNNSNNNSARRLWTARVKR